MSLRPDAVDSYCTEHSSLPSSDCAELERYTMENVSMPQMVSGPLVASFLGFLIHTIPARRILEIGCYTGYSALAMAERLPQDGELVTLDINAETMAIAKRFWDRSPHGKKIHGILKPAQESLRELKGPFDLVFVDADKEGYLSYLKAALPLLSPNGVVVADNCLWQNRVVDESAKDSATVAIRRFNDAVRDDKSLESCLLPIRDGLHVIRRKG